MYICSFDADFMSLYAAALLLSATRRYKEVGIIHQNLGLYYKLCYSACKVVDNSALKDKILLRNNS